MFWVLLLSFLTVCMCKPKGDTLGEFWDSHGFGIFCLVYPVYFVLIDCFVETICADGGS